MIYYLLIWVIFSTVGLILGLSIVADPELCVRFCGLALEIIGVGFALSGLYHGHVVMGGEQFTQWFCRVELRRPRTHVLHPESLNMKLKGDPAILDVRPNENKQLKEQFDAVWKAVQDTRASIDYWISEVRQEQKKAVDTVRSELRKLTRRLEELEAKTKDATVGTPSQELLGTGFVVIGISFATFSQEIVLSVT